jgi:hypothetical protein
MSTSRNVPASFSTARFALAATCEKCQCQAEATDEDDDDDDDDDDDTASSCLEAPLPPLSPGRPFCDGWAGWGEVVGVCRVFRYCLCLAEMVGRSHALSASGTVSFGGPQQPPLFFLETCLRLVS